MWCRSVQQQIVPYVDGKLTGRRNAAVAGHLERCRVCSAAARGLREVNALLDGQPEAAVPPEFEALVISRIRGIESELSTPHYGRWLLPLAAGACAVGVALYLGYGVRGPGEHPGEVDATAVVARVPSAAGSKAAATDAMRGPKAVTPADHEAAQAVARPQAPGVEDGNAPNEGDARGQALVGVSQDLPQDLFDSLDLFVDFPIIWELEKFEHYETIWASSGDQSVSATRGG